MKPSTLRPLLQSACVQFDRKTLRERLLMMAAISALLYLIVDASVLTPQASQIRQLQADAETRQTEMERINMQIAALSARLAKENSSDREAELDELKRIIAEADALLSEDDGSSLKLSALLETMLSTTPGLTLVSLKTLPVMPLRARSGPTATDGTALKSAPPIMRGSPSSPDPPPAAVYQHGVEIAIKGNFLTLLPYMEKLRRYPKRLFWTSASLEVVKHPDSILYLTITTLSEQQTIPLE
jgi:MSHA biogenesis protein MshJ